MGGSMALYGRPANSKQDIDWSMVHQEDGRDPRAQGRGPCGRKHTPEKSYRSNQWGVWLNCEVCALRLHYAPKVGAPQSSLGLGPTPAHVEEMLSRLPTNKSEVNGNMVRGLLKIVQGEAQVRNSSTHSKNSTGTTTKNKDNASSASSTHDAAAGSAGSHGDAEKSASTDRWEILEEETTAAVDRWEILVRRLHCRHSRRGR